ncbi:MAG: DnaJ domain-containing protein [Myxococcota bacterium]
MPVDPVLAQNLFEIEKAYEVMTSQDYYALLGVAKGAAEESIKNAYFELAKRWHSDRIVGKGLPEESVVKAEELFHAIEEAFRTLTDPETRKTYDFVQERRAKGLPTDPAVVMEAESLFLKGKGLLRRGGQAAGAEEMLRKAVELNKGEAEFLVYLGYAVFSVRGRDGIAEAHEYIHRGLKMNERLDAGYEFLGRIARVQGKNAEAERQFKRATEINPKNVDAERELRLLSRRQEQAATHKKEGLGGVLDKLFKR